MLSFETLEPRVMMAASITQSGGLLTIEGTDGDDAIRVEGVGYGLFKVFEDTDGDGEVDKCIGRFSKVTNITIKTGDGDDAVGFMGGTLGGNLTIDVGEGRNDVVLQSVAIKGNVTIDCGSGNDLVSVHGPGQLSSIGGRLNINTGAGKDLVLVEEAKIGKALDVDLGADADMLGISQASVYVDGEVTLNGGFEKDVLFGIDGAGLAAWLQSHNANVQNLQQPIGVLDLPWSDIVAIDQRVDTALDNLGL